jgi:hypothetical protein
MSEYMFGTTRKQISLRDSRRLNNIARINGAYGFTNIIEPTGQHLGWFAGPNRGCPFDLALKTAVMTAVNAAGLGKYFE